MSFWHHVIATAVNGTPLDSASWGLHLLPLVGVEDVEELAIPAGGVVGPGHFWAATEGVIAGGANPADSLVF